MNSLTPCAGFDLQPRLLGVRGMELLISMVLRNECGAPDQPMTTTVPATWLDGPTVRDMRLAEKKEVSLPVPPCAKEPAKRSGRPAGRNGVAA